MVEADMEAIVEYIAHDNARAAIELCNTIVRRVAELAKQPRLYRAGRVRGTREMVVHPHYVVIYRLRRDAIEIIRVLHTARQWPLGR